MKKRIRLTESDLHRVIKESVNKILNETYNIDMLDVKLLKQLRAKEISLEDAAREFCRHGWTPYVDIERTKRFLRDADDRLDDF